MNITLQYGKYGWYVEWFQDGEVPMVAYWYGSRIDCLSRMQQDPPMLCPMRHNDPPPHDAATATGMYD